MHMKKALLKQRNFVYWRKQEKKKTAENGYAAFLKSETIRVRFVEEVSFFLRDDFYNNQQFKYNEDNIVF